MCSLKKYGDNIEREFCDFISQYLPNYIFIWESFIGNDGNCNPLPLLNATEEVKNTRDFVNQVLYTSLISVLCMKLIADKSKIETTDGKKSLDMISEVITFHAHCGRTYNSIEKLFDTLKIRDLSAVTTMKQYWETRCTVIHEYQFPYLWEGAAFLINTEYEKKSKWCETNLDDLDYVDDYYSKFEGFVPLVNQSYSVFYSHLYNYLKKYSISLTEFPPLVQSTQESSSFQEMGESGSAKLDKRY